MSVLENAIRNALARSDRADAEIRAKVYQSARGALDNGLLKQGIVDPAIVSAQRERLEILINAIEAEEQESVLAAEEAAQAEAVRYASEPEADNSFVPDVMSTSRNDKWTSKDDPSLMDAVPVRSDPGRNVPLDVAEKQDKKSEPKKRAKPEVADVRPEKRVRRSRARSSIFTRIFVIGILLAFGIGGVVWVKQSGLWALIQQHGFDLSGVEMSEDSDTTPLIKNPLDPRRSFDSSWLDIFTGSDATTLETKGDATVEPAKAADGAYALITSASAEKSGEVSVPVSADILAQISGKPSTIALTIGSGDDTSSQVSVECDFAGSVDCGRHRFNVTAERGDFLFRVNLPAKAGGSGTGNIILNSDVSGSGKSVKLFAIRVLPGE